MLSYQHIYHCGNLADVHKHMLLSLLLNKLVAKDKPITYMETHAGRGYYSLNSEEIKKTNEANDGIIKLIGENKINSNGVYYQTLKKIQQDYGQDIYGGSPLIAKTILRDKDQLYLMELHPQEYQYLKNNMKFKNTHVHKRDGYEGVLAISPPNIRRGIILIDPSFEVKGEYLQVVNFIKAINKKWAEATIMLWYPILKDRNYDEMVRKIESCKYKNFLKQEITFKEHKQRMLGSGVIVINTPYEVDKEINKIITVFA